MREGSQESCEEPGLLLFAREGVSTAGLCSREEPRCGSVLLLLLHLLLILQP